MTDLLIDIDGTGSEDVRALIEAHLAFAVDHTPPGHVHALGVDGLDSDDISFFSARRGGVVVGMGALRRLDDHHAEIKSIHTAEAMRGGGVARAMVDHLISVARSRGFNRVSLETGTMEAFGPARALFAASGFEPCKPFSDYTANPNSICMTLVLDTKTR